ncbi:MAG: hypothetical protein ABL883_00855 [Terricaulis sp.]
MRALVSVLALGALALLAACSLTGRAIDRSLSGLLPQADVAPRGAAFLVVVLRQQLAPTPFDYANRPLFARFDTVREGADFRIVQAAGFLNVPSKDIADVRSLYAIPGVRGRYVLEYSEVQNDQSRRTMATLADRRCEDDTCVLALAESLPIGSEPGQIDLPSAAGCVSNEADTNTCPLEAQAFAAAAAQLAGKTGPEKFDRFFLLYQDAQPR